MPDAAVYHGPAELTPVRAFTSWTLDVPVLVVTLLAAGCYLAAERRLRRTGGRWPASAAVYTVLGLLLLVYSTMSWIGVYQNVLFWARAVQTIMLLLLVPLLLSLGRPLTLAIATAPEPLARRLRALILSRAARIVTFPVMTTALLIATPFVLYFSGWYAAALPGGVVREITYLALIAAGYLFFWTLLRVDPVPKAYPYLLSLWITAAEVVFDAVLGIAVIADQSLIARPYYQALGRPWGPSLRVDQILGGGALWLLGDLVGLPFLGIMLIQMIKEDAAEAAQVDAELDAREAAAVAVRGNVAADRGGATADLEGAAARSLDTAAGPPDVALGADDAAAPQENIGERPWWETDPQFTHRFRELP